LVPRVEEAPARLRVMLAWLAVLPVHARELPVDGLAAVRHGDAAGAHLAPDHVALGNALAEHRDVVDPRLDGPALGQALPDRRRLARPEDRDVLTHGLLVAGELALQALAEGEQQQDRHRAPRDRRDRERRALLLEARRAEEEMRDDGNVSAGHGLRA